MAEAPTISFSVPSPPSANRLWRKVPGRRKPILSADYREWLERAGWQVSMQLGAIPPLPGFFRAEITVPAASRKDLDNWSKPLFDLCQRAGVVVNDNGLKEYNVKPADRSDCLICLWDLGGEVKAGRKRLLPEMARPRSTPLTSQERKITATYARLLPK